MIALRHAWATVHRALGAPSSRPPGPGRPARLRARFLLGCLLLGYGLLAYRLYTLQIVQHPQWQARADRQHNRMRVERPERGRLMLRDGDRHVPAVISVERGSLLVEGHPDRDVPTFLAKLRTALPDLTPAEEQLVAERLAAGRSFYLRRRALDRERIDAIRAVRLEQASVTIEPIRRYAFGPVASHVLGLIDAHQEGVTGIERTLDAQLRGTPGRREVILDNRRRERVRLGALRKPAIPGDDVLLSIDRTVQAVVERELERTAEEHKPQGSAAVVIDPRTVDVLAMASWPTYDPTDIPRRPGTRLHNRAISYTYEPGSTIKPLIFGTVWQLELGAPDRPLYCPRIFHLPGRRKPIVDCHTVGQVTESEAGVESSNTGSTQLTNRLTPAQLRNALTAFGFGRRTGIQLPGEAPGNTHNLRRITPTTLASLAQGYALSVTPLQMALAYAALANGGTLFRPRLVVETRSRRGQLFEARSPQAVARPLEADVVQGGLRDMMVRVVNSRTGTAKRAKSKLYTIAGKTGTTKQLNPDGHYDPREVVASFCGFAPAESPRIAFSVVVWAPDTSKRKKWGGTVAAPCAGRIADQALTLMRVPPHPPARDDARTK